MKIKISLVLLMLIGFLGLVVSSSPVWTGYNTNYTTIEDAIYNHNLSKNITGFANDVTFEILPSTNKPAYWTNSLGAISNYTSKATFDKVISDWISITNSSTGNLSISPVYNNQTGYFIIPIQATNISDSEVSPVANFNFIINATNDAPDFTLNSDYNVSVPSTGNTTKNISLVGSDEEEQYPLEYNVSFDNCSFAQWSTRTSGDCNLTYSMVEISNTTSILAISNLTDNDVGVYNLTVCTHDNVNSTSLPKYRVSDYDENKSRCYNSTLNLLSSLSVDVSNCSGATLMEGEEFNCTVNVTTPRNAESVDTSSFGFFKNDSSHAENSSWFHFNSTNSSSDFVLQIPVSMAPRKQDVGNWTINFSSDDGSTIVTEPIDLYVNYTESGVSLDSISNLTGSNAVYENRTFNVKGYDDDLLIRDSTVKNEQLTYVSNVSWVNVTSPVSSHSSNYTTSVVSIDYDNISSLGYGNYSVMINVSDVYGNSANKTFVVEIANDTAPEWNTLPNPVSLNLTEDSESFYNVSMNVTDAENDNITFYYENVSAEFCSLNSSTFNSSGIINFIPTDCDVGYHNVTIIASDGKLNSSHSFNFTVENAKDVPGFYDLYTNDNSTTIGEGGNRHLVKGTQYNFTLIINDSDFLIPTGQRSYYNESLNISDVANNFTYIQVGMLNFSFVDFYPYSQTAEYLASFTPNQTQVGNWTVVLNVTDNSSASINRTFYLNISDYNFPPVLSIIGNRSLTIYDYLNFTVNASDNEDGSNLSYSILNLSVDAPNLTVGNETGIVEFNMSSNSSYAGIWGYNVTAMDSGGKNDTKTFYVYVYGNSTLLSPLGSPVFNLTENSTGILNFTINHSVGDNLTYEFWVDSIGCSFQNNSNCSYGDFVLRDSTNFSGNGSSYNWSFSPNYTDETYGNYKNLTVRVYPSTSDLSPSQKSEVATNFSFKLNVSHTNAPPKFYHEIGSQSSTYGSSSPVGISLWDNFRDYDYSDSYYLQNVTFTINSSASTSNITVGASNGPSLPWSGIVADWDLQLYAKNISEENLTIMANDSFSTETSNPFTVTFSKPSGPASQTPSSGNGHSTSGGGGSTVQLKYFSLKLITPEDVTISNKNYVDVSFSVQNKGLVDLFGISLRSIITFNNTFSNDVNASFQGGYINSLKVGESKNFTMRIVANMNSPGKYKATIFANVTSPKFSDSADFFIDVKKANESEARQLLVFTDQFLVDNSECVELTELLNRAKSEFDAGNYSSSLDVANSIIQDCEDMIKSNNQIKHGIKGFSQDNFYYLFFATLLAFFIGMIFYVYKRVKFNKYEEDEYI